MNDKEEPLYNQLNLYEEFKEQYLKITEEFQFDPKKDIKARDLFSSILKKKNDTNPFVLEDILKSFKNKINSKRNIFVYGCGPSLESTIKNVVKELGLEFFKKSLNIAADGASIFLREQKIPIHAIVTDLDGITKEEFNNTEFMIIHGHGDNIGRLNHFKDEIINFKNVIGTTQVSSSENLINPGGFTDGDRILYILRKLLLPSHKIFLFGMDFDSVIGKYSKPYMEENQDGNLVKKKKLKLAVHLIEKILPNIENDIFFVNIDIISNNFKYLSLEGFKKMDLN